MAKIPEDIFQNVDQQPAGGPRPAVPVQPKPAAPVFPAALAPQQKSRRWVLLSLVALVLVLGLGVVAITLQRKNQNPTTNVAGLAQVNTNASQTTSVGGTPKNLTVPETAPDADKDGLTDADEQAAGTDAKKVDTDSDQLSDFDEVQVYKTDPRKPDTDGDANPDGVEVKKGYNPKGAGFLRDFQGAKNSLTNTNS
ncbi:MAG: hypothetical protein WCV85_01160 [Patescibacteria group bacterium]|jgi:uncharacterized protein HemX